MGRGPVAGTRGVLHFSALMALVVLVGPVALIGAGSTMVAVLGVAALWPLAPLTALGLVWAWRRSAAALAEPADDDDQIDPDAWAQGRAPARPATRTRILGLVRDPAAERSRLQAAARVVALGRLIAPLAMITTAVLGGVYALTWQALPALLDGAEPPALMLARAVLLTVPASAALALLLVVTGPSEG
ncbi:MAG: hypothetical protein KGP10_03095 [Actinomycetales bacterium]|nr:hypothetical protein [Actinomycetales bacterium]